jgi:hypothetical protein
MNKTFSSIPIMKAKQLLPILLAIASSMSAHAATWIAGRDLVANEEPDGPQELVNPNPTVPEWSYGYRLTLESTALTLFTGSEHVFGNGASAFQGFQHNTTTIAVNTTASPQLLFGNFGPFSAGEMFLHTGASNEFAIVRWTAPAAGTFQLDAGWRSLDGSSTGVTTSVVINGSAVFDQTVSPLGTAADSRSVALNAGDTVDFALGANGSYLSDVAAFDATISTVPEPSSALLFALGGVAMLQRWRRLKVAGKS